MVYISGQKETVGTIQGIDDEYKGSATDYEREFWKLNPHVSGATIPPYTPVILVSDGATLSPELKMLVKELARCTQPEREHLHHLQQTKIDIPTMVAMHDIMEGFRKYTQTFRDFYDAPLINTPWLNTGPFLTNSTMVDVLSGLSKTTAQTISQRHYVLAIDHLYEAMCKRDALNQEYLRLSTLGKSKFFVQLAKIEQQAKEQTAIIKSLLPKKIEATLFKYLDKKGIEIYKARANSFSLKMARKGQTVALRLDLLNASGQTRVKSVIKGFNKFGDGLDRFQRYLGPAIVLYDTAKAYEEKKDYKRVLFSGAAGTSAGWLLSTAGATTAWGGAIIGTLAGDAALGSAVLVSSPVLGTVVLFLAGAAFTGYATYKVSNYAQDLWDSELGQSARTWISDRIHDFYKGIQAIWDSDYNAIKSYYGS